MKEFLILTGLLICQTVVTFKSSVQLTRLTLAETSFWLLLGMVPGSTKAHSRPHLQVGLVLTGELRALMQALQAPCVSLLFFFLG